MNKLIIFIMTVFLSSVSFAGVIYPFTPQEESEALVVSADNAVGCDLSAMTIQNMINLTGGLNPNPLPVNATDCYAVENTDNDFASTYDPNTGELYDGMFNGESKDNGKNSGYYVDPNLFLDHANDQWVDANTPGWISLASINGAEDDENEQLDAFEVSYSEIGDIDLGFLLDITFGVDELGMGFWSLGFDDDAGNIIGEIETLLGRPTRFDHLSFVFKGPNNEPWYMYDFSFWDLMAGGLDVDLNAPHNIFGTWDPSNFFGGQNVSHIEIVAHDPPPTTFQVPEPQSSLIFTLGLIVLALRYKMKV